MLEIPCGYTGTQAENKKVISIKAKASSSAGQVLRPIFMKHGLFLDDMIVCDTKSNEVLPNYAPIIKADKKFFTALSQDEFKQWIHRDKVGDVPVQPMDVCASSTEVARCKVATVNDCVTEGDEMQKRHALILSELQSIFDADNPRELIEFSSGPGKPRRPAKLKEKCKATCNAQSLMLFKSKTGANYSTLSHQTARLDQEVELLERLGDVDQKLIRLRLWDVEISGVQLCGSFFQIRHASLVDVRLLVLRKWNIASLWLRCTPGALVLNFQQPVLHIINGHMLVLRMLRSQHSVRSSSIAIVSKPVPVVKTDALNAWHDDDVKKSPETTKVRKCASDFTAHRE
ncbi:unnamed protein product [Soboliphyme baturini]|uniref:Plus3 domain-containing protein n=1 Tax=Soboliphyme baturini TaxID=241478 RepID=A0A183IPN4_9BILA|nr:unnamed protein product [Soboliphyme baturini]